MCELEQQILQLGGYTQACRAPEGDECDTVNGGACLAPIGPVSEVRKATPGGWGMSCAELVADDDPEHGEGPPRSGFNDPAISAKTESAASRADPDAPTR